MFPSIVRGGGGGLTHAFLGNPTATGTVSGLPATTFSVTSPASTGMHAWRMIITQAAGGSCIPMEVRLNNIAAPTGGECVASRNAGGSISTTYGTTFRMGNVLAASKVLQLEFVWDYTNKEHVARWATMGGGSGVTDVGQEWSTYTDSTTPATHTFVNSTANGFSTVTWQRWDNLHVTFPGARVLRFM